MMFSKSVKTLKKQRDFQKRKVEYRYLLKQTFYAVKSEKKTKSVPKCVKTTDLQKSFSVAERLVKAKFKA